MATPKVTILMLTYNRSERMGRAISSACRQTFEDWELILVQDGGNAETTRLAGEWLPREPRLRYFARETVGTISEASNFGLAHARGEYIAILDDDDSWSDPEKLARQVDFLDHNPDYVGCGGGYTIVDQGDQLRGTFFKPEHDAAIRAGALLANPMANSTAVFRREVTGTPVRYDPSLRQFADWDFWLTLGLHGKLYNFPAAVAHYSLWEGGSSFRHPRGNARAAIRIICKHRSQYPGFPIALLLACLYFTYACLPLAVRRHSYTALSALKKSLAGVRRHPEEAFHHSPSGREWSTPDRA